METEELREKLLTLGEVFVADEALSYRTLFHELVREQEFELALHAVCDYLVAEGAEFITPSRIMLIEALCSAMDIEDDCIAELESARSRLGRH